MSKGYTWFKHYASASQGESLRNLISCGELEAVAIFWIVLELICRWEKPESRGEITVSWPTLAKETGCYIPKVRKKISKLVENHLLVIFDQFSTNFKIRAPKWSELQGTPGPNYQRTIVELRGRGKKEEVRGKNKDIIVQQVELDCIYQEYPRKQGKSVGMKRLRKGLKPEDLPLVAKAVRNYAACVAGRDPQYIKIFSSFASEWRDWVDYSPQVKNDNPWSDDA